MGWSGEFLGSARLAWRLKSTKLIWHYRRTMADLSSQLIHSLHRHLSKVGMSIIEPEGVRYSPPRGGVLFQLRTSGEKWIDRDSSGVL